MIRFIYNYIIKLHITLFLGGWVNLRLGYCLLLNPMDITLKKANIKNRSYIACSHPYLFFSEIIVNLKHQKDWIGQMEPFKHNRQLNTVEFAFQHKNSQFHTKTQFNYSEYSLRVGMAGDCCVVFGSTGYSPTVQDSFPFKWTHVM